MRSVLAALVIVSLFHYPCSLSAQDMKPFDTNKETSYFDFLCGDWFIVNENGQVDTSVTFSIEKSIHPGALKETWMGKKGNERGVIAIALRAWDKTNSQWKYVWISENGLFQNWEGRKVGDNWYFHHYFNVNGDKYLSRQGWLKTGEKTFMRISEKSYDEGTTWELRFKVNYTRK